MICRPLFFQKVHPLSLLPAWALRSVRKVLVWRSDRVPAGCLERFERIAPEDVFSVDDWLRMSEEVSSKWREAAARLLEDDAPRWTWTIAGARVDLRRAWLQRLAKEYEETYLFLQVVERWAQEHGVPAVSVCGCPLYSRAGRLKLPFPSLTRVRTSGVFFILDRTWLYLQPLAYGVLEIVRLVRAGRRPSSGNVRRIWMGHIADEAPAAERSLDFSFLCGRGLLSPEENLYVLASSPSPEAARLLARRDIRWVTQSRCAAYLSWGERIRAAGQVARLSAAAFLNIGGNGFSAPARLLAEQAVSWSFLARSLRPEMLLTTISFSWPESAAIPAMNAFGVRTAIWFYSANCFKFSSGRPEYRDIDMGLSIMSSREIYVWSRAVEREYMLPRLVERGADGPVCRVTGPLMCGDMRWLDKTPAEARNDYGLRSAAETLHIAVFDVLPHNRKMRLSAGHGPSHYTLEMLERFYEDILGVLEKFPQIRLLIKSKRSNLGNLLEVPESLQRLIDPKGPWIKEGRATIISSSADPYIPVALADFCVGIPFTSPVIAGWSSGRPGVYYDPLSSARYTALPELEPAITRNREDFLNRIEAWAVRGEAPYRGGAGPADYIAPRGDSAKAFVDFLNNKPGEAAATA